MERKIIIYENEIKKFSNDYELGAYVRGRFYESEEPSKIYKDINSMDSCVVCGITTPYNKSKSIEQRYGYIEGVGQLCLDCYKSTYNR
jgi:hypothetical protein